MANSADPDQLASSEAKWSGSTLFAKEGHIRVQQDRVSTFTVKVTLYLKKRIKNFVEVYVTPAY